MIDSRFEHIAFNVPDMDAVAEWYVENLGLSKVRYDRGIKTFLADRSGTVILELYSNPDKPYMDFTATSWVTLHLAFVVEDIEASQAELLANGATVEDPIRDNMGDMMVMLRDPFGIALQLIHRSTSLLEG